MNTEPNVHSFTVSLNDVQLRWLEQRAGMLNLPMSEVVRSGLHREMVANPVGPDEQLNQRVADYLARYWGLS